MKDTESEGDIRVSDRLMIADVLGRYCRAVDRRDWNALRAIYHPDATDNHASYNGSAAGFIDFVRARHESAVAVSLHHLTTMLIEFGGPDVAVAETYVFVQQRYSGGENPHRRDVGGGDDGVGPVDMLQSGRYIDRFERRDGKWKIARRTFVMEHSMRFDVPANAPALDPAWVLGARDRSDVVYEERSRARIS